MKWQDVISITWLRVIYVLGSVISLAMIALISVDWRSTTASDTTVKVTLSDLPARGVTEPSPPEWLTPEPLPFPSMTSLRDGMRSRFKIPAAEFKLAVERPQSWSYLELSEDQVRFQNSNSSEEYVSFSAGCFGDCDRVESNIAESLASHVEHDYHRGQDPRVVHWYVHHKTWVEYSLLYRESDGRAWMTGVSVRWSPQWLNALKCTYRAPVNFPYESEQVLHLAWDIWAVEFIRYCRRYEVLSWE